MTKPCENPECSCSTGIGDFLTFGWGELDQWGFWKHPCFECARRHEAENPDDGACWPFSPEYLKLQGFNLP